MSVDAVPATAGAASVTFEATVQLGVYSAVPIGGAAASAASPAGSPGSSAAPIASADSGADSSRPSAPPPDPNAPVRFAVDLFNLDEAAIAPGSAAMIERLGTGPGGPPAPGASAEPGTLNPAPRTSARDELWHPLLLVVLVLLCVEWAVYQRDALVRIRRSLAVRWPFPRRRST
jgi:hypothetical protein